MASVRYVERSAKSCLFRGVGTTGTATGQAYTCGARVPTNGRLRYFSA